MFDSYERAKSLLQMNIDNLYALADALLEKEVLDAGEIDEIVKDGAT